MADIDYFATSIRKRYSWLIKNLPNFLVPIVLFDLLIRETQRTESKNFFENPTIILLIIALAGTLFNYFFRYLESGKSGDSYSNGLKDEIRDLRYLIRNSSRSTASDKEIIEELKILKERLNNNEIKGLDLNENEKTKLFELLELKLEKNLSQEFLESIQKKFGSEILASERYSDLLRDLSLFKERLNNEIRKLSLRANTNLSIGSVTTLVAVIVLYLTVVTNHPNFNDSISLTSYFIPRISLVVFIEVFSFFFLKLYKSNLDNIRYYHNEMTNIEMKIISLKSSIINSDKPTINEVIKELSKTERNFIIKKGETTIELERFKTERAENKGILEIAKDLIIKNVKKHE